MNDRSPAGKRTPSSQGSCWFGLRIPKRLGSLTLSSSSPGLVSEARLHRLIWFWSLGKKMPNNCVFLFDTLTRSGDQDSIYLDFEFVMISADKTHAKMGYTL